MFAQIHQIFFDKYFLPRRKNWEKEELILNLSMKNIVIGLFHFKRSPNNRSY